MGVHEPYGPNFCFDTYFFAQFSFQRFRGALALFYFSSGEIPKFWKEFGVGGSFKKKKGVIFYHQTTNIGNSGVYAIDWAASKGYEIYTAGIDFYLNEAENEDPARIEYMKLPMINSINKYIKTLKSHSDSTIPLGVFKFSERSRLECEVKVL